MTMFSRSGGQRSEAGSGLWTYFHGLGGADSSKTPAFVALWALVGVVALINFTDLVIRWLVVTDASWGALGFYAVGGRLIQAMVFFWCVLLAGR